MQHRFAVCVLLLGSLGAAPAATTSRQRRRRHDGDGRIHDTFTGTLTKNGAVTYAFATGPGERHGHGHHHLSGQHHRRRGQHGRLERDYLPDRAVERQRHSGVSVIGNATTAGNLCIRIHDVGLVVQPATYQIDVSHF